MAKKVVFKIKKINIKSAGTDNIDYMINANFREAFLKVLTQNETVDKKEEVIQPLRFAGSGG